MKTDLKVRAVLAFVAVMVAACADMAAPEDVGHEEQAALAETLNVTPTAWVWYYGVSADQLTSLANSGYRIVSLQVTQTSPLAFTVAMVQNTGTYAKMWWVYYGLSGDQLSAYVGPLNARIVVLDAYEDNGSTLFAAVLISNTGADAKAWSWYYGINASDITPLAVDNNMRLVDLRSYATPWGTRYAVVMISNTGADAMWWGYYYGIPGSQLASTIQQENAFLVSIQPTDASGSAFNVILEPSPGVPYWWNYNLSAADVGNLVTQHGARLLDVKSYHVNGALQFAAVAVPNTSSTPSRIGHL